jgi:hypothetical protein
MTILGVTNQIYRHSAAGAREATFGVGIPFLFSLFTFRFFSVPFLSFFCAISKILFKLAGGRGLRAVPYNPLQFRNVRDMAVTPSGVLYAGKPILFSYFLYFIFIFIF